LEGLFAVAAAELVDGGEELWEVFVFGENLTDCWGSGWMM